MNTKPPEMTAVVRSRWTSKDEALLQELTERKARIDRQNREPIVELAAIFMTGSAEDAGLADWLIENATQLRALLEPFAQFLETAS